MRNDRVDILSPYQQFMNHCDECGNPMAFNGLVDTPEGEFELLQCPCGYTEHLKPVVDNDDPGELFKGVE